MSLSTNQILASMLVLEFAGLSMLWYSSPISWEPPEIQPPAQELTRPVEIAWAPVEASSYPVQVARPLFVPGRRPVVAEALKVVEEVAEDIEILGIFGASEAEGGVIVRIAGEVKRVGVGQKLGGLLLLRLDGMEAVFLNGGREQRMKMQIISRAPASAAQQSPAQSVRAPIETPPNTTQGAEAVQ